MQLDAILEVAIGLVFVWLVISVATMEVQNRIGNALNWRAKYLEKSILGMLKDPYLVEKFYAHPLIVALTSKDKSGKPKRPDFIPNSMFAKVACEIMLNAGVEEKNTPMETMSFDHIKSSLSALAKKNPYLMSLNNYLMPDIKKLADNVENVEVAVAEYRQNTEIWFDEIMVQTGEWYKMRAQQIAFLIGLAIAVFMNVDTIQVAQKLWQEPTTRAVLIAQAQKAAQTNELEIANKINFPIGWTTTPLATQTCVWLDMIDYQIVIRSAGQCRAITGLPPFNDGWGILVKLFGYFLSAAAAAQGAPFWFDVLNKLANLREKQQQQMDNNLAVG